MGHFLISVWQAMWRAISGLSIFFLSRVWGGLNAVWQVLIHPRSSSIGTWAIASPLLGLGALIIIASFLTWAMPLVSTWSYESRSKEYDDITERSLAVALFDSEERFAGYLNRREEIDIVRTQRPTKVFGREIYPDHKSIVIDDAPPH